MAQKKLSKAVKRVTAENSYDPTKSYKWDPETVFELKGEQFGFIMNVLLSKEAEALRTLEMIKIMREKLATAVRDGAAWEYVPETESKK